MNIEQYVDRYPQEITLVWIDGTKRAYPAKKAFLLCKIRRTAGCIIAAECGDLKLEAMLNKLLDNAGDNWQGGQGNGR